MVSPERTEILHGAPPEAVALGDAAAQGGPLSPLLRRRYGVEVAVALAVGVIPALYSAVWAVVNIQHTDSTQPPFIHDALWLIVRSLQVVAVALYIMWRSAEDAPEGSAPWGEFGIWRPRWSDLGWTTGLYLAVSFAETLWWWTLWAMPGFGWLVERSDALHGSSTAAFPGPSGPLEWVMLALMSLANGLGEQIVLCGLLLPRMVALLGSRAQAVSIMTLCFISYHVYQGWVVVVLLLPMGVLFGSFFLWRRRLWPLVLAHAGFDFTAYAWAS